MRNPTNLERTTKKTDLNIPQRLYRLSEKMNSWRGGNGMGRQLWSSKVCANITMLIFIAFCISVPTTSYAQAGAQEGFLSIDCGYTGANYTDPNTNLTWTADYDFIKLGEISEQSAAFNSADAGSQWLQTFRFFPEPSRRKYCYELPTTSANTSYLIRASFYLNETMLRDSRPFQFNLYIDATSWFTLTSGDESISSFLAAQEVIFQPPLRTTNFCMQPVIGVPFISSLELRELQNTMYDYTGDEGEYLALLFRYNLGATNMTPSVRFPDDIFDRIWQPAIWPEHSGGELSFSTTKPPDNKTRATANFVPPKVMESGWEVGYVLDYEPFALTSFALYSEYLPVFMTPSQNVFAVIYTEHLNNSDSNQYGVNVSFNDQDYQEGNFSDQATMYKSSHITLSSNTIQFGLNLKSTVDLADGPTMNAVEAYGRYAYDSSLTNAADIEAIAALKTGLNLSDWQGDPCTPVPYDWLSCNVTWAESLFGAYPNNTRAEKPCGFNGTYTTYCVDEEQFSNLELSVTTLKLDNVSNVNTGLSFFINEIQETQQITWLQSLSELSITNSGLTSETLGNLLEKILGHFPIITLDLSYNAIEDLNCSCYWISASTLTSLDLSHNHMSSLMTSFLGSPLQTLDVSYNELTSLEDIGNSSFGSLSVLDLSHNQLQGSISSLDNIVQMNADSLQELNIANNNLDGSFSSSIYFSELPKLTIGIFDGNNIQGTLDLSKWYATLLEAAGSQNSTPPTITHQLFSFVNNSIADISPSAETMKSVMDMVMNKHSSTSFVILLGGNPYCTSNQSYAQQYLCRNTSNQSVHETIATQDNHNTKEIILIIAIGGGIIALLLTSVTSATLWKLWKQVYSLRAIQQALAERKVQPPFYQYNDLKLATKDFHKDYKLGHGGFGIVYKGILADATKIAVKKLYTSKRSQAQDDLHEFLNEVVLITGIKHRNLVQLNGCCIKDKERLLVFEYVENGNLAEALWGPRQGSHAYGGLNWDQRFNICVGVARGLSYLHEGLQPSIIHRDIKPANILLDNNFRPKIADFGLARHSSHETSAAFTVTIAGTLGYFAPEYATEGQLSDKADVYSYGIVVLEIISGRKCIDHSLPVEEVYLKDWIMSMSKEGMLLDVLQHELRDKCVHDEVVRTMKIGLLCVQNSPRDRPSMSEVVTMLEGSRDVKDVVDEFARSQRILKDILESVDNFGDIPLEVYSTL